MRPPHPPGRAVAPAGHLRLHARLHLPRRGRAHPPAHRAARVLALHPEPGSVAAGRRHRDRGGVGGGHRAQGRAERLRLQPAEAPPLRRSAAGRRARGAARRLCGGGRRTIPTWSLDRHRQRSRARPGSAAADSTGAVKVRAGLHALRRALPKWPGDEQRKLIRTARPGWSRWKPPAASTGTASSATAGGRHRPLRRQRAREGARRRLRSHAARWPPASALAAARARTSRRTDEAGSQAERVRAERMARSDRAQADPCRRARAHCRGGRHSRRHRESRPSSRRPSRDERYDERALSADRPGQVADARSYRGARRIGRRARRLRRAAAALRSLRGADGFVSLEVSPYIAARHRRRRSRRRSGSGRRSTGRTSSSRSRANPEGIPAIREATAAGISINITLIFSVKVYAQVIEAYLSGLEERVAKGLPISQIHSVASFFVSRVDTAVDKLLEQKGNKELAGKIAVANAKVAYQVIWSRSHRRAGRRWRPRAPPGSGRSGPAPAPRTRPTAT